MKETKNTQIAREKFASLTDKPIEITSLAAEAKRKNTPYIVDFLGASIIESDRIVIALNYNKPETHETTFIHEVTHQIIAKSGFPRIDYDLEYANVFVDPNHLPILQQVMSYLISSIEHPEVYRQMTEFYDLDMKAYFDSLIVQKMRRFALPIPSNKIDRILSEQQDIVEGIEYHYYHESVKKQILDELKRVSPQAFDIVEGYLQKLPEEWYRTPIDCESTANLILRRVIDYGESNRLGFPNHLWKAIKVFIPS